MQRFEKSYFAFQPLPNKIWPEEINDIRELTNDMPDITQFFSNAGMDRNPPEV